MKYKNYTKTQLIDMIHNLENSENKAMDKRDELIRSQYYATGYLGPWHWDVKSDTVTLHPVQHEMFNLKKTETLSFKDYLNLVHEDDKAMVEKEFQNHLKNNIPAVEIEYRIRFYDKKYHWLYHRAEIDESDASGNPIHVMAILMDITEKRNTVEHLNHEKKLHEKNATLDFLTNLLNRRGLHVHSSRFFQGVQATKKDITIAMFDIDNFKHANDTFGHEYGDQVLLDIANLLREHTRNEDIVSRFGGDEFLLIFTDMKLEKACRICERIRQTAQEQYKDAEVKITLSGGVKEYEGESMKTMIKQVDTLLYKAKRSGKNKIMSALSE